MHLKVKPFIIGAKDWSGEVGISALSSAQLTGSKKLHATTTMATSITYWNLSNSHWEPCAYLTFMIDLSVSKCVPFSDRPVDIHYWCTSLAFLNDYTDLSTRYRERVPPMDFICRSLQENASISISAAPLWSLLWLCSILCSRKAVMPFFTQHVGHMPPTAYGIKPGPPSSFGRSRTMPPVVALTL